MIFKPETIKTWFEDINTSINNSIMQPSQNAEQVIWKYNQAIQHNSLTQQGWARLLAQSDNSLKAYLISIKGATASMDEYSVSLLKNVTGFNKVLFAIKQYNSLSTIGTKEQSTFTAAVSATNEKLGTYLTGLNGAHANLKGYGTSLIASTAKTIGLTVATTALNAALTMGISAIISGVVAAFTAWINKSEEITEKAQEAADKISSINENLKSNIKTVEDAKKRYAELAQKVQNFGQANQNKGTLSNEEYEEFLDLSNQLLGVFPSLINCYDANGNAILNLSGNVDTIINSLDNLIQKEKELANQTIMKEFPDFFTGWAQDLAIKKQNAKNAQTEFEKINNIYQQLSNGSAVQAFKYNGNGSLKGTFEGTTGKPIDIDYSEYIQTAKDLGLAIKETKLYAQNQFGGKDYLGTKVELIGNIDNDFTSKFETTKTNLEYAQQQLQAQKSSIDPHLYTWLQGESMYNQIDNSGLQQAVQKILFNFDWSTLPKDIDKTDWEAVSEYLRHNILFTIHNIKDNKDISNPLSQIVQNTELTPDEKSNYFKQLQDYFGVDNAITLSLKPEIKETEALQKQYHDVIDFTKNKFSWDNPIRYFKEQSINTQDEIDLWKSIAEETNNVTEAMNAYSQAKGNATPNKDFSTLPFYETWNALESNEHEDLSGMKENLLSLAGTGYLTRDTFNETEGTDTFLSRLGIGPNDVEKIDALIAKINQLKSSKDQLSSMESGISGLSDNLSYREENPGEAISSDVFSGMDSGLKDQAAEWEQYQSVLGNAGSSMDEVREATNKLASAYVNSNNFLANLTEANKDYYVSQLNEMGVANSAEIVEERLTAQREISQHKADALSLATNALASVESSYAQNSTDSINAAYEQSAAFVSQSNMTDYAKSALADLIAHQTIFSSNTLNTSDKIASLSALANAYLGAAAQASFLNKVSGGLNSNYRISPEAAWNQVKEEFSSLSSISVNAPGTSPQKAPTTGGSTKSPDKQPEKKEFKESFNWLERFIKRLKSSFDKWLAQAETALTNGFLNIYYQKAASLAKSQLSTYSSAYNKDMEKANAVGLDEKYAEKVRNGALDIDTIEDEGLAKKIKEYQDWYDKAQDSMDSFREIAEKLYNLPLDKAAKKVDIFSNAIDLLNKELDNKTKYTEKNKIIDKQTTKEKQTLNAYKKAEKETKKSLSSAKKELLKNQNLDGDDGITARERKMIQKSVRKNKEVNLSRFTENSAGYQAAVKYNEALKARKKAGNDRQSAQQDYNRWKVEASKLKFDNIAGHYDKKIKRAGYRTSAKDNKMSELEAAGRKVNISYYKAKKTSTQKNLNQYEAEKKDLEKSLTHIKKYTDEWYDAKDQIQQVSASISDCVKETYELNNAINQLHFDMFDDISNSISRIITEQEFLQGLFAHEKSTDAETGKFTEAGLARLGSLSTSYYASKNNADRDKTEVDELRRMLDSGTLHSNTLGITFNSVDDLQKKLSETYTKWQDDIKQTHSLESALADIVKEKYQAELDKLQELINARKEAMNAEKDLHDYQRTISQKTRDIATVRKQIAAYSGDTSEEGRAKLQRLQKELDDKEDDLRETEYNRLISDQQAMLDKLYEQYRELTEKKMDDFHGLVEEGHRMAQENAGIISSYLSNIATANDYKEENKSLLAGISTSISGNVDNIIQAIVDSRTALSGTKDNNEGTKNNNDKKNNNKKKSSTNKKNNNKKKSSSSKKKSSNSKKNGSSKQEVVLEGSSFKRIPTEKDTLKNLGFSHLEPDILFEDYHGRGSLKQASLEQEVMILNTMERTSDIYAAPDTRKPRILSGNMLDASIQTLSISDVVPDLTATPSMNNLSNVVNIDSITLPNVTNYDEFKDRMFHDMQNNGNYIRFVNDTSLNRTDGMGRLAKNTQTL